MDNVLTLDDKGIQTEIQNNTQGIMEFRSQYLFPCGLCGRSILESHGEYNEIDGRLCTECHAENNNK